MENFDKEYFAMRDELKKDNSRKAKGKLIKLYYSNINSIKQSVIYTLDAIKDDETKRWMFEEKIKAYDMRSDIVHGRWVNWNKEELDWIEKKSIHAPSIAISFLYKINNHIINEINRIK